MTHYETLRDAQALDDHRVAVTFDSGTKAVFDCSGYFGRSYWKKLSDPVFFKSAHVEYGHLTWPGDIDISPLEVWEDVRHNATTSTVLP